MNSIDESLQTLFPNPETRNKIYAVQKLLSALLGTALGAYAVWLEATGAESPAWVIGAIAVFTFLGIFGPRVAQAHLSPAPERDAGRVELHWKK